jgi:phosphoglycolate phosphatase
MSKLPRLSLKAVFFDLDGTLIDSAPDIAAATNALLASHGIPALSVDQVRGMIGNGVKKLVQRAFDANGIALEGEALDERTSEMMGIYARHLTVLTNEMPGASAILRQADAAGLSIAVLTNKPEIFTREIITAFGWSPYVDCILGGDSGPARKPAPDMLLHVCRQLGILPAEALMIGDSPADIGAAKAASVASIAVRGGYTNVPVDALGADRVVSSLNEALPFLETDLFEKKPSAIVT